jgi:hypothetical protein
MNDDCLAKEFKHHLHLHVELENGGLVKFGIIINNLIKVRARVTFYSYRVLLISPSYEYTRTAIIDQLRRDAWTPLVCLDSFTFTGTRTPTTNE